MIISVEIKTISIHHIIFTSKQINISFNNNTTRAVLHGIRQIWCQNVIKLKTANIIRNNQLSLAVSWEYEFLSIIRININIAIQGNTKIIIKFIIIIKTKFNKTKNS